MYVKGYLEVKAREAATARAEAALAEGSETPCNAMDLFKEEEDSEDDGNQIVMIYMMITPNPSSHIDAHRRRRL